MGMVERKQREREDRERRIVAVARRIASADGWSAVTIRRLADEIEYSQPVLYSHFANRAAIVGAVAVEGFRELASGLKAAASDTGRETRYRVADAYLSFARKNPALYEAMFTLPTDLRFAEAGTRVELKDAFAALVAIVPPSASDVETTTEALWSALHGLADLERSGRIRPSFRGERVRLIVDGLLRQPE